MRLTAFQGDDPCPLPAPGPCSNDRLTLTHQSFQRFLTSCIAFGCQTAFFLPVEIAFIGTAPAYAWVGFEPPLADGPVTVRGNRALPLEAELLDQDGFALTDADLSAAPVVQVGYLSGIGASPAPGTHVISMISGDGAEHRVDPTCEAAFVNP